MAPCSAGAASEQSGECGCALTVSEGARFISDLWSGCSGSSVTSPVYHVAVESGPQRIASAIHAANTQGRAALMICLPWNESVEWLLEAARVSVAAGADLLEFQVRAPYHPSTTIDSVRAVASYVDAPCLIWSDFAVVHAFAIAEEQPWRLVPECVDAGICGVVCPSAEGWIDAFASACGWDLASVNFMAPDFGPAHLEAACRSTRGFAYAIGLKTSPASDPTVVATLAWFLAQVRKTSGQPVFVGAGVATPKQAALAAAYADGVAVAKAVFETIGRATGRGDEGIEALSGLVRSMRVTLEEAARPR